MVQQDHRRIPLHTAAVFDGVTLAIFMTIMGIMDVSVADAKNRLPELIRAFEAGETVVITRHGKPVVQLASPDIAQPKKVVLDGMRGRVKLHPGWDDPVDLDRFLAGDI